MADVFISYSRKDRAFVHALYRALKICSRDTWIDWQSIPLTADWWNEICRGIETTTTFIIVVSPSALESPMCNMEIDHALSLNKRIVPVVRKEIADFDAILWSLAKMKLNDYTQSLIGEREILAIARNNWFNIQRPNWPLMRSADNFKMGFKKLIDAIDTDLTYAQDHTHFLVRAREWLSNTDSSLLLRGNELRTAETWLAATGHKEPKPTEQQIRYILASRVNERTQQRKLLVGVSIGLVVTTMLSILSLVLFSAAQANEQRANNVASTAVALTNRSESLRLTAEANMILQTSGGNVETAALLSIRALNIDYSLQADAALVQAINRLYTRRIFAGSPEIAFLSNDTLVVAGNEDGSVQLWDSRTGQFVRSLGIHLDKPASMKLSPDGKLIVGENDDGSIQLWDSRTGQFIRSLDVHLDRLGIIAISSNSKFIIIGHEDGSVQMWDIQTGNILLTFVDQAVHAPNNEIYALAFSPDGRTIATGNVDGTARLRDSQTGQILHTLSGQAASVTSAVFSPDGKTILMGSADNVARLWDSQTGQLLRTFSGHTDMVFSVAFSPDSKMILTGSADGTARLWDSQTGQLVRTFSGHTGSVFSLAFSPDGKTILTESVDGTVRLWDTDQVLRTFIGRSTGARSVAFSPNGEMVLTGNADGISQLWDKQTNQLLHTFSGDSYNGVTSVAFSPDGKTIITGYEFNSKLSLWNVETAQLLQTFDGQRGDRSLSSILDTTFAPDSKTFFAVDEYGTVWLRDIATGQVLTNFATQILSQDKSFSRDGKLMIDEIYPNKIELWNVESGKVLFSLNIVTTRITSLELSVDGTEIMEGNEDGSVQLWNSETGQLLRSFDGHTQAVTAIALSPAVTAIALSADNKEIVAGSADGSVQLWDSQTGQLLRSFHVDIGSIASVAFSPDGKMVLTASYDASTRLWDTDYRDFILFACSRVFRDFTDYERQQFSITDGEPTCPIFGPPLTS